ncbi:C_GCAxxG_C_C family protein [Solidesulfovibrio fructosivorans JJ]]|uniref:C_GCAxxG_C_C family protein n=2 Tax=Solidesulfovibrio fructosivorans TaxID=878 RepID=E1K251_SOLFR|nr:C_GCAxxG_C_C family protein [Solidesulfovibrio fructosivorans JJ]]
MLLFDFFRRNPLPSKPPLKRQPIMNSPAPRLEAADALVAAVGKHAAALFANRKLLCAEAIMVAVNEAFGQPLPDEQAVGIAAGLTAGIGDRGCLCGAIAGACASVGMVCARGGHGPTRQAIRQQSAAIHEAFVNRHKSACCRVLSKKVKDDAKAHAAQCAALTGYGAELAVRSILALRPELVDCPDAPTKGEPRLCGRVKWLLSLFCR